MTKEDDEIPAGAGMTNGIADPPLSLPHKGGEGNVGSGAAPDISCRIIPNKNRQLQVAPTERRLFGEEAQGEFLEWFAATCNASLAARKIGFHYRTVLRHWRENEAFGARCEEALKLGYARLEELALRSAEAALEQRPGPIEGDRAAPPETLNMSAADALQLLRDHKRGLDGSRAGSGPGSKRGRRPRVATNAEVREALIKRLAAFGIRVSAEDEAAAAEQRAEQRVEERD